jgi:hypothetical protein
MAVLQNTVWIYSIARIVLFVSGTIIGRFEGGTYVLFGPD